MRGEHDPLRVKYDTLCVRRSTRRVMNEILRGRRHSMWRMYPLPGGRISLKLHAFDIHQNGVRFCMDRTHCRGENPVAHPTIMFLHALPK